MTHAKAWRIEGGLLLFVVVPIVVLSGILVVAGRTARAPAASAMNLNSASADAIAVAFGLHPALARRFVERRAVLGGFAHTDQALRQPVLSEEEQLRAARAQRRTQVDVNRADARSLAAGLSIGVVEARRIVEHRSALPGARFSDLEQALRTPLVSPDVVRALPAEPIVRDRAEAVAVATAAWAGWCVLAAVLPLLLRRLRIGGDPLLAPLAMLLGGLGASVLFSVKDPLRDTPVYLHHIAGVGLGCIFFLLGAALPAQEGAEGVARLLPSRAWLRRTGYLWALTALALLVALALYGTGPGGVRVILGFFRPVEAIRVLLVLFLGAYLAERGDLTGATMHRWGARSARTVREWASRLMLPRPTDVAPMVVMYALALFLFIVVRDLGPAMLLFGLLLGMLYVASGRPGVVWSGVAAAIAGVATLAVLRLGVTPLRVEMWRTPWDVSAAKGTQLAKGLWAMASGGMWGSGLGLGSPGLVPRAGSDMVFASLAEELGLIGVLTVLFCYAVLCSSAFRAAAAAATDFDRYVAVAIGILFAVQVGIVCFGVTGLLPLSGLSMPFLAYGNSSLVADFLLLGLLRGISAPTGSVPVMSPRPALRRVLRTLSVATTVCLLGVVGWRAAWVQIVAADEIGGRELVSPDADAVRRSHVNPRLVAIAQEIPRGTIYDRHGRVLATSRSDEIAQALRDETPAVVDALRMGRLYPRGEVCAHLVGHMDPRAGGPTGIERLMDLRLRGFRQYADLLPDYRRKDLPAWLARTPKRSGADVVLTIDAALQESAYDAIRRQVRAARRSRQGAATSGGAFVALDPATGEVLAAASYPSYDPNRVAKAWSGLLADVGGQRRLVDRALDGVYPPGSALKVATAAAALEGGLDPVIRCAHQLGTMAWTYRGVRYTRGGLHDDGSGPGHGRIGMERALAVSCNVYFANLGLAVGPDALETMLRKQLGFKRAPEGAALASRLPDHAIGQGLMRATPLEMARMMGVVAAGGQRMAVRTVKEVRLRAGAIEASVPSLDLRALGDLNAARLGRMLRGVTETGTARYVFDGLGTTVAGKTGTAEVGEQGRAPHSWFAGFAPAERPRIAFACIIENGGYGRSAAAPACRDALAAVFGRR